MISKEVYLLSFWFIVQETQANIATYIATTRSL